MSGEPVRTTRLGIRHSVVIACGPIAHIPLAAGLFLLWLWTGYIWPVVGAGVVIFMALGTVVPRRSPAGWSDGHWLMTWLRNPDEARRRLAMAQVMGMMDRGKRPRELDLDWLELLISRGDTPRTVEEVSGARFMAFRSLDLGEPQEADRWAKLAHAGRGAVEEWFAPVLDLELAFVAARLGAVDDAERWLAEAGDVDPRLQYDVVRAKSAVLLAAGRPQDALLQCERALKILSDNDPVNGLVAFCREEMIALQEQALTSTAKRPRSVASTPDASREGQSHSSFP